jgi:2-phosphoglycerate kinase
MNDLQRPLLWLGGSPCAGKSTVADAIAARFGWEVYRCDAAYARHVAEADPQHAPTLTRIGHLHGDALWMRPVAEQTATEIALYREEFAFILRDIAALSGDEPVIIEGAALLPELVAPLLGEHAHGAWLVPTPAFQRAHYARRAWAWDVVAACSDPPAAFNNWMTRDIGFAAYIAESSRAWGVPLRLIDIGTPLDETIDWVLAQWEIETKQT